VGYNSNRKKGGDMTKTYKVKGYAALDLLNFTKRKPFQSRDGVCYMISSSKDTVRRHSSNLFREIVEVEIKFKRTKKIVDEDK